MKRIAVGLILILVLSGGALAQSRIGLIDAGYLGNFDGSDSGHGGFLLQSRFILFGGESGISGVVSAMAYATGGTFADQNQAPTNFMGGMAGLGYHGSFGAFYAGGDLSIGTAGATYWERDHWNILVPVNRTIPVLLGSAYVGLRYPTDSQFGFNGKVSVNLLTAGGTLMPSFGIAAGVGTRR